MPDRHEGLLAGRSAVVTGASRGIGLACANALAGAGARVALVARHAPALQAAASGLGALATPIVADVSHADDVERLAADVTRLFGGAPDIVVNNAGLFTIAMFDETTASVFSETLATNLTAPFLLTRALLPMMVAAHRGDIVTLGSVADRAAFPGNAAYAASKFGARALHQVLRAELTGSGVRATLVSPGPVNTSLWDPIDPDARPGFTPRAKMLSPEAVADAVLWAVTRPADVNIDELRLSHS